MPAKKGRKGVGIMKFPKHFEDSWRFEDQKQRIGIETLFFILQGRIFDEVELPVTIEFTTHGLRTTLIFERAC